MLSNLIDLNQPSAIPAERRQELNRLAIEATKRGRYEDDDHMSSLVIQSLNMIDVLDTIIGLTYSRNLYLHIDKAFESYNEKEPKEGFRVYRELTAAFRELEKNKALLEALCSEAARIKGDLDIIELEEFDYDKEANNGN